VLAGLAMEYTMLPAMREGPCGTPAPIELSSIGSNPDIRIVPAITVSCDVAAALHKFTKEKLQPLAQRMLGAPIGRINSMSSYSCRNRYGEKKGPLSYHALASAIDIRGFRAGEGDSREGAAAVHRSQNGDRRRAQDRGRPGFARHDGGAERTEETTPKDKQPRQPDAGSSRS
jgi:hypothetical protein